MSEVIGRAFENDEDKWMDRYKEVIATLENLTAIGIAIEPNVLNEMSAVEKDVHLDALALQIIKHEWEQHAK